MSSEEREGIKSPDAEFRDSCELPCGILESNLDSSDKQLVLLTAESSHQPLSAGLTAMPGAFSFLRPSRAPPGPRFLLDMILSSRINGHSRKSRAGPCFSLSW